MRMTVTVGMANNAENEMIIAVGRSKRHSNNDTAESANLYERSAFRSRAFVATAKFPPPLSIVA